jgi:hypothetical protein
MLVECNNNCSSDCEPNWSMEVVEVDDLPGFSKAIKINTIENMTTGTPNNGG